jgi:hypothetical protein
MLDGGTWSIEERALFSEPGIFLVRPDRTLYWATVQSMPGSLVRSRNVHRCTAVVADAALNIGSGLPAIDFGVARCGKRPQPFR